MKRPRQKVAGRRRRGAAIIEFAAVAPVLFLLVFGMIEFGRLVMVQQVLTNASREGARLGILDGTTASEVESTVVNYLRGGGIPAATGNNVVIDPPDPTSAGAGESISVTVTINYDQVSWLPAPMFLSGQQMSATTVMRRETVQ